MVLYTAQRSDEPAKTHQNHIHTVTSAKHHWPTPSPSPPPAVSVPVVDMVTI